MVLSERRFSSHAAATALCREFIATDRADVKRGTRMDHRHFLSPRVIPAAARACGGGGQLLAVAAAAAVVVANAVDVGVAATVG